MDVTEAEWLACTNPERMLDSLEDKVSARRFRLYYCAVLRQCWTVLGEFERRAIEEAERHFDTLGGSSRPATRRRASKYERNEAAGHIVEKLCLLDSGPSSECLALLLCIFGNPFRPVTLSPAVLAWNDATVVRLARATYEERHMPEGTLDNGRLAVLADALEEAGCSDADVLGHLRGQGKHVRGCWAVDLLLGKG
jgi:hypothetical protein